MKRILVTGSAGLIGGQLVRECQERWPDAYVHGNDLINGTDCRQFFRHNMGDSWDLAIHCAAITGGIEGTVNNSAFQSATNSQLDGAYFEWALKVRPTRIVYISSSCAYPIGDPDAIHDSVESDIDFNAIGTHPDAPYGWAKLNGEVMANAARGAGLSVTTVRPFAIVGPKQEDCRIIPALIKRALSDDGSLTVWGPGTQASDFVAVSDCANAILELVTQEVNGPVNIATGRGATADEVAEIVMNAVGVKKPIAHDMSKPSGPRWRVGDPTYLNEFYKPVESLESVVASMVAAHQ